MAFCMFIITAYIVLALRWDISAVDAAAPFLLLIVLAAAITAIGEGDGRAFFYIAGLGQAAGGLIFAQVIREARRNPVNREILDRSDFTLLYAAGFSESAIALLTAVLLHVGIIGIRGAVAGAGLVLLSMLALTYAFVRSGWRVIGGTEGAIRSAATAGRRSD